MAGDCNVMASSTLQWNKYFTEVSALISTTKNFPFKRQPGVTNQGSANTSSKNEKKKDKKRSSQKRAKSTKNQNAKRPRKEKVEAIPPTPQSDAVTRDNSVANSKNATIVYSKFDFGNASGLEEKSKKLKGEKNLKFCLKKQTRRKEQIEKLLQSNSAEGNLALQSDTWSSAMSRAKGVKVKDDIKLLKKAIQQKKDKRRQSAKQWKERVGQVEEKKQKRQDRRRNNLKNRAGSKKKFKHTAGF